MKTTFYKKIVLLGLLGGLSACSLPDGSVSSDHETTQDQTSTSGPDRSTPVRWETNDDYADLEIPDGDCINPAERKMFELINQDRESFTGEYLEAGKNSDLAQPLEVDCDLVAAARAHSRDMFARDFFAHVNPDGLRPFDRVSAVTDRFAGVGENIAWGADVYGTDYMQDAFMDEPAGGQPNHRGNILNPRFTHVGVGIVAQDGYAFITQDFGIATEE